MRLDAFLKKSLLIKRRELANQLCDEGMVRVNGVPRKASHDLKVQDEIEFPLYNRVLKVRVLSLPEGNVKKADQWSLFEVLEDKRLPLDLGYGDEDPFAAPSKPPRNH
ncbi:RNA-binding S4 domain-containing protein [Geothrix fermentans]|uniref:RNA-binding S4 domain-containing protein n=1 Tax=Geothrix fermentans TaxID=44676 RepID=UPI000422AA75|nr:RNA-binding S4 domain-containing protein [Geothrix fermentans]